MTKAAELAMLDTTIASFGQHSYIGPWLAENRDRIATDIATDYPVSLVLPDAAYRQGTTMIADTKAECTAMLAKAREQADAIVAKARKDADDVREHARRELVRLADHIGRGI